MDLRKQNSTFEERTPPEGSNIAIFTSCSKIMLPVRKSDHMSAAFDIVDQSILLKKLELYGFEKNSLDWIQNYLTGRS